MSRANELHFLNFCIAILRILMTHGDGDDDRDQTHKGKSCTHHMGVLPLVTQIRPVHWMSFARPIRSKREEARTKFIEGFTRKPKLIHWMR